MEIRFIFFEFFIFSKQNFINISKNLSKLGQMNNSGSKIIDSRKTTSSPLFCDFESDLPNAENNSLDPDTFDVEIERMYIEKFRQQREKIQTITRQFEQQKSVLEQKVEQIDLLEKKVTQLNQLSSFKKKYEDLYRDYKTLENDHQKCRAELENAKSELTSALQDKMLATKEMRALFKDSSYKFNQQISELRELIEQKQRLIQSSQQKGIEQSKQLSEQLRDQQNKYLRQAQQWKKASFALQDQISQLTNSLAFKDSKIRELQQNLLTSKKNLDSLNYELQDKDNAMISLNQQYKQLYQKMKFHIRSLKKQLFDKQQEIISNKQSLLKATEQTKRVERKNAELTETIKSATKNYEENFDRSQFQWSEEKRRYLELNAEFKSTIEELVKAKNHLTQENERLLSLLRQKDGLQKLRNEIKRNEFYEIDRVERIVRKI